MSIEADYLVVGAGAMGMAFTDVILNETDASVVLVDRLHAPGGHWNKAYPFVRLHQPSSFYGVNSRPLGNDTIDRTGWNEGLYELATNGEVCAYFDHVMREQFLPSGRVRYLPMSNYTGAGCVESLLTRTKTNVVSRKIVDATFMNVLVPSMRPPPFEVDPSASCLPLNALPESAANYSDFVVVGAGKTGFDACLFLLQHGVEPDSIRWIMPRDAWLLNRASIQALDLFEDCMLHWFADTFTAIAAADSLNDAFVRIERAGQLLRLDPNVEPTMYRCCTVTEAELAQVRRIRNVVRLGRVQRIAAGRAVLDDGELPFGPATLFVDCTADGLARRPPQAVFAGETITLQSVRTCQQVFSAAFIAHVEAAYDDEILKNELATPVPHPDSALDLMTNIVADLVNAARWAEDDDLAQWMANARLDGFSRAGEPSARERKLRERIATDGALAAERIQQFIA